MVYHSNKLATLKCNGYSKIYLCNHTHELRVTKVIGCKTILEKKVVEIVFVSLLCT